MYNWYTDAAQRLILCSLAAYGLAVIRGWSDLTHRKPGLPTKPPQTLLCHSWNHSFWLVFEATSTFHLSVSGFLSSLYLDHKLEAILLNL